MYCKLDDRVIEQIIAGTEYPEVQRDSLAQEEAMTLGKASQIAKNHEASVSHMKQLRLLQNVTASTNAFVDTI